MSVHEWLLRSCIAYDDLLEEREGGGGLDPHAPVISNLLDSQSKIAENMPVRIPSSPISEKNYLSDPNESNPPRKNKLWLHMYILLFSHDMKSIRDCYWLLRLTVEFSSNVVFIKKKKTNYIWIIHWIHLIYYIYQGKMNICIVTEKGGPNRYAYACASCPIEI